MARVPDSRTPQRGSRAFDLSQSRSIPGRRGVGVILTYRSNKEGAEEIVRSIEREHAVKAVALQLDLSQTSTFESFAQRVQANLEGIWQRRTFDYLVNNGGIGGGMMFTDATEEYFDRISPRTSAGPTS